MNEIKLIRKYISDLLGQVELDNSIVIWDSQIHEEDEKLSSVMGGVVMPFRGTVAFVDLKPRANWAHPCMYIAFPENFSLVGKNEICRKIKIMKSSFPPLWYLRDNLPESASVILRYNRVPDDNKNINPYKP